jgi:NodT family efflux transporter outer membrane factor (OMF) lipoprotein
MMEHFSDNRGRAQAFTHAVERAGRRSLAVLLVLSGTFGMSGCKVGPDYQRPDAPVNEKWLNQSKEAAAANAKWWETFNDPMLTSLVQSAQQQNLPLKIAGLRVLEARAARGIAVGKFFPQTQEVVGGVGLNQISLNSPAVGSDRSFATDSLGLQAAWELDFWGKFRRGIEAADAELQLSVADYDSVMVSLEADVASNYILLRSLEERLKFTRDNAALQTETLRLTEARFRAGAVSELDVSTARATLANTQALIPDLENGIRQEELALGVLLGRTPSDLATDLGTAEPKVPDAPVELATGVPADLLRRRPDVRAAERAAAAQSARIGEATADLYPSISITGQTGFVSSTYQGVRTPTLGNIFDANSFAGFIGLQVNWPVLNYGRIEGNIRVQDALYEQAVAAYQDSVVRAAADVEGGLADFIHGKTKTFYLTEAVDASNRSVELSLIQYRSGAVDFIRVNNAQVELVQQQDTLVIARASIALGAVRTFRALGGGWEVREGKEFVDDAMADRMRKRTDWGDVLEPNWQDRKDIGFSRPAAEAAGDHK